MIISSQSSFIHGSAARPVSRSGHPGVSPSVPAQAGDVAVFSDKAVVMQAQGQLGKDWGALLGGPFTNWPGIEGPGIPPIGVEPPIGIPPIGVEPPIGIPPIGVEPPIGIQPPSKPWRPMPPVGRLPVQPPIGIQPRREIG
jgi:hypothetical protein